MEFAFWLSLCAVLYAYFGYPMLVRLLAAAFGKLRVSAPSDLGHYQPMVTLLISAYNEESAIEEKIRNSLELDYPRHLLEIVIVSDGSTDRTDEVAMRYAIHGVTLRRFEGRIGKSACLNQAVERAQGEIVVFSDANSQYDRGVICSMVEQFTNGEIGFVTGHTHYQRWESGKTVDAVGLYSKIERWTKRYEGRLSSCVGADGAIFAIRRALFTPIGSDDINDLVIPFGIVRRGFRGILDESAVCTETLAKGYGDEFGRQVRIATRTIRAVLSNADLLNPLKHGIFAFQVFSHKLVKLMVPCFLVLLAVSNLALAIDSRFYRGLLAAHVAVYGLALVAGPATSWRGVGKVASLVRTLLVHNGGVLVGWVNVLSGRKFTTWTTARR